MKARLINKPHITGETSHFNTHALSEVLMGFDDGDLDSMFVSDVEVYVEALKEWKSLSQAFKDHDVITDNYNTCFFEPDNETDRKRGYSE